MLREAEFTRQVKAVEPKLRNLALKWTGNRDAAEDVLQEALVKAWLGWATFKQGHPFYPWMARILWNASVDARRKRPKVIIVSLDAPHTEFGDEPLFVELPDKAPGPEATLMQATLNEFVQQALDALPPSFREAVRRVDMEEQSYDEIALAMDCSVGTVRSRIFRGRQMLRRHYEAFASL